MFASSINLERSRTTLDHSVRECFTRYSSDPTPLLYLFCISYDNFVSISWFSAIPLSGVSVVLKVVNYFIPLLNHLVVLLIICGGEILRVILVRSRLIVHSMKSSNSPNDSVAYYILMNSITLINSGLSTISSMKSTYTMTIKVHSSYTLYKTQGKVLIFWIKPQGPLSWCITWTINVLLLQDCRYILSV